MDLVRHLSFFVAIAEHRHFGNAASALGMAQPPLSQGLQRLERHLGQRLFDRDARKVALTPAGAALLPRARRLVEDADDLVADARSWTDEVAVRIGLAEDLGPRAGQVMADVARTGTQLLPRVAGSSVLLESLRAGELDLALVRHPALLDGLLGGEVLTVEASLVRATSDPRAPVVLPPRRHHPAAHDQLVDALLRVGVDSPVRELSSSPECDAWVEAGLATGLRLAAGAATPSPRLSIHYRTAVPVLADQRPGIDLVRLVGAVESALS